MKVIITSAKREFMSLPEDDGYYVDRWSFKFTAVHNGIRINGKHTTDFDISGIEDLVKSKFK